MRLLQSESGFTYLALMGAVAIIGILTTTVVAPWKTAKRIDLEEELLFRGQAIRTALELYYKSAHAGFSRLPDELEDLLPTKKRPKGRFIRKLYTDPITGGEWSVIRTVGGRIKGVRSTSDEEPLKKGNFPEGLEDFEDARRYSDWEFIFDPSVKNKS